MFVQGHVYRRKTLHDQWGGQQQGGISTPVDHTIIFLFTSPSGEQHGYTDGWSDAGTFLYTGEGQHGDMQFTRGNRALHDHAADGKDIHLFEQIRKGYVRYVGQMVCTGYDYRQSVDTAGVSRRTIVFELHPLSTDTDLESGVDGEVTDTPTEALSLDELRSRALSDAVPTRMPVESKSARHPRSRHIRLYVLERANGSCEGCGAPAPFSTPDGRPYLEPHHIRRLSDGGPDHPRWVIALCPNCHRRAHYAVDARSFNQDLSQKVQEVENGGSYTHP
ncbi:HNH endonuclease [Candidatus Woesearchaeota archaeon]|nr:HNH endonuclease [Candidatus Woesearchaeota archaeon]